MRSATPPTFHLHRPNEARSVTPPSQWHRHTVSQLVLDVAANASASASASVAVAATAAHFKRISFVCSVNHLTITHVAQTRPRPCQTKPDPTSPAQLPAVPATAETATNAAGAALPSRSSLDGSSGPLPVLLLLLLLLACWC